MVYAGAGDWKFYALGAAKIRCLRLGVQDFIDHRFISCYPLVRRD